MTTQPKVKLAAQPVNLNKESIKLAIAEGTLRHTHATRLIQNGMNIYEVKHMLGHSDIKTTMRYAHLEATDVSCRARDVMNRVNSISVGAFGQAPSLRTIRSKLSSGAAQSPQRILFAGLADSRSSP